MLVPELIVQVTEAEDDLFSDVASESDESESSSECDESDGEPEPPNMEDRHEHSSYECHGLPGRVMTGMIISPWVSYSVSLDRLTEGVMIYIHF